MASQGPVVRLGRRVVRRLARAVDLTVVPSSPTPPGSTAPAVTEERDTPRVLFVLGSQRSGTNALRRSLSLDPWVMGFNERENDRWYRDWRLKPEPDLRAAITSLPCSKVLFKPILNVTDEPVLSFLDQWAGYRVSVTWIYRDPVDVYNSQVRRWPDDRGDVDRFVAEWHRVNQPAVEALDADGRFTLSSYEDLTTDTSVYWGLARRLGVRGENLFRGGPSKGRQHLDPDVVTAIDDACRDLRSELDRRRSVLPEPAPAEDAAGVAG